MPAVTIHYPRGFFDATDKVRFKRIVKQSVATNIDAINPATGEKTDFGADPDASIDLLLVPYDREDAELTTPLLGTIVTYDWPDRVANLPVRVITITQDARHYLRNLVVDDDEEAISFTFIGKRDGAWAVA